MKYEVGFIFRKTLSLNICRVSLVSGRAHQHVHLRDHLHQPARFAQFRYKAGLGIGFASVASTRISKP